MSDEFNIPDEDDDDLLDEADFENYEPDYDEGSDFFGDDEYLDDDRDVW